MSSPEDTSGVLLLQPWVEDYYATDCRVQPIGLAYLAGSLRQRFPDLGIEIYDSLASGSKRSIAWPVEFEYLKRYYGAPDRGPFSLFHQYFRFGDSDAKIITRLRESRPKMIGISSLFTPYYRQSLELARLCRVVHPDVPIVMGGNHASMHPGTLLEPSGNFMGEDLCDFVIRGEGEEAICQLYEHVTGKRALVDVAQVVTKKNYAACDTSVPPETPERSMIPEPDFCDLDPRNYLYDNKPLTFLITSRSCPHRCTFCSIHAVFGFRYETRPVDDIIREIEKRHAEGIRHFDIEDDNFTFRKAHTLELLDRIIALKLPIRLSAMNGISYLSLDRAILQKMRAAGFESLNLSLVSSDKLVLEFTQRPHTVRRFEDVTRDANELGFSLTAYFILGMPGQTLLEMWDTLRTLADTRCLVGASPFYFTPGSPIHRKESGSGDLRLASEGKDPYLSARLTAMDLESGEFDRDDIYTLFRLTRLINHVKKGLDAGEALDGPCFDAARVALEEGCWHAECRGGKQPLPFSPRVASLIAERPISIRGYSSERRVTWEPRRSAFCA